jgi:hypothetical protein
MTASKKSVTPKHSKTSKTTNKTPVSSIEQKKRKRVPNWKQLRALLVWPFVTPYRALRGRREQATHKSFTRTRKRDKIKVPKIEGYIAFPWYVLRVLWNRKWVYMRLVLVFAVLSVIFIGTVQASNMSSINSVFDSATSGTNIVGPVLKAVMTVGSSLGGALNANLTDVQYIYISALYILALLTVIWLIRHQLAGKVVKLRDGLYSAGAPIAAEYILILIGIVQLIPLALATLLYVSATASGILDGGIETAMFSVALFLVVVLTLYFMTTTLFALFIASIPGTYPLKAYKAARRLVAGQRLRLLLRLLWMVIILLVAAFVVLVPIIIIANSIGGAGAIVIPIAYQLALISSIVYATAYAYLLYRRMIDDPVDEK